MSTGRLFSLNLLTLNSDFALNTTQYNDLLSHKGKSNIDYFPNILLHQCSVPVCSAVSAASLFQHLLRPTLRKQFLHYFRSVWLLSFFFICLFCVFCLCEWPCVGDISMLYVPDNAVSLCDCRVAGCSLSSFAAVKATSTCCSVLSCRTVPLPDFTALMIMIREMFKPFRCSMQACQNALTS